MHRVFDMKSRPDSTLHFFRRRPIQSPKRCLSKWPRWAELSRVVRASKLDTLSPATPCRVGRTKGHERLQSVIAELNHHPKIWYRFIYLPTQQYDFTCLHTNWWTWRIGVQ